MNIQIDTITNFFILQELNPIYALLLIPIAGLLFFNVLKKTKSDVVSKEEVSESFRFSIKGYSNGSVKIGLFASENLSGGEISEILMTALPIIGKKDPDLLRLLLFHCLEALDDDKEVRKALTRFQKNVS